METISLDLAQRFKEAGIKIWTQSLSWLYYPTAEELWARLPERINFKDLCIYKHKWKVICEYVYQKYRTEWPTLAEALGEMYIYLFTNWLIWKGEKPE